MKAIETLVVLAIAAGFASVSFAETTAVTPAAEPTKTVAAKPMVKKHHHKMIKKVSKTGTKTEATPSLAAKS